MASPKRNANRRKFNRQPLDVDDLTSASSFSGIRDVIESHFGKSENADQAAEAGGGEGPRNVEADPEHPQYVWEPKGVPFSVRLDADVIGRLEKESLDIFRAITNRGSEIGGILLGEVLPGWPVSVVVRDYEPVPCAYTLGPSYLLSDEEQERLGEAIETRQKASGLTVVGFFRSNTRPALVLQDDDLDLFEEFFPEDHNIFVLAKPFSRKPCQGAIYVREGGKIRTDSSPLEFAFSRAELEKLGALQPGLRLASQPSRLGPASSPDRAPAIPIDSAPAEFKRPPAPVVLKPEPPSPVETKPAPSAIGTGTEPPAAPVRTEPKIEPRVEPRAEPPLEQRIEARLPWLKPSSPPPAPRPAAPPSESAGTTTPASPARPLFTPPPRVETRATPPEPPSPPPAARPAAPPSASARTSTPASPVRPLFTPPRVETRATPPEPPSPPPAARPAAPPAESAGTSTPANPARPLFTPPPKVETVATPTPEPPSPPRFSARIQSRIPPSVQPRIATNLGSKPAPGAGPAQPTRFMTRMEPRTAPQQPKPEPKPEATLAPKVEPAVPPQPAVRIEPVVVVRPPAQPRAEVEAEPKVEPKAEVKVEPRVEPPSPRFTRIQPGVQPRPEPEPQPAAPPADDLQSVFRRKPEQGPPPQTAPSFGYDEEAAQGKHRWILPVVIALVIVVVGVYFFVIRPNRQTVEEAPAAAAQLPAHRQAVDLPLRVEGFEGALTIFWDGLAAPISTAPRGVLSIRDGAGTKTFDLTSDELKKGTYGYKPRTDDVLVRLELKGLPGGQSAYGVTHIFGARRLGKTSAK